MSMSDPKEEKYDHEAATLVPESGSSSAAGQLLQTPSGGSGPVDLSEAATMLELGPTPLSPISPITHQNPPPAGVGPPSPLCRTVHSAPSSSFNLELSLAVAIGSSRSSAKVAWERCIRPRIWSWIGS